MRKSPALDPIMMIAQPASTGSLTHVAATKGSNPRKIASANPPARLIQTGIGPTGLA
jgi:hypothetical protein